MIIHRNQFDNNIKSNQLFIRLGVMFALIVSLTACCKTAETKDTSEEGGSVNAPQIIVFSENFGKTAVCKF